MPTLDFNILGNKVSTTTATKDLAVVSEYNSYVQKIENICKLQKGEIPSAMNLGSDYYSFIFNPSSNKKLLETNLENYIKSGIKEITNVKVTVAYSNETKVILNVLFSLLDNTDQQAAACTIEVNFQ